MFPTLGTVASHWAFLSVSGAPGRFGRITCSGVQAQPTTIIPANEAVATLANTTWKSNADFFARGSADTGNNQSEQAGLVKLCSVEHISVTSMRRWPQGSGAELAAQQ